VEELYDRIEDILEEDGKGDTNTIIMGDWKSVIGDNQTVIFAAHIDWEIETKEVKCLLTCVEELDSLSLTCGLKRLSSRRSKSVSAGLCTRETAIQK
jgi:predicted phosphohydrolase